MVLVEHIIWLQNFKEIISSVMFMEGTDHEVELHEIEIAIFLEIMTPTLYGYIHSTKSFQIKREKIFFFIFSIFVQSIAEMVTQQVHWLKENKLVQNT